MPNCKAVVHFPKYASSMAVPRTTLFAHMLPGELLAPQFGMNRRSQTGPIRSSAKQVNPADAKAARQALENLFREDQPVFSSAQRAKEGVPAAETTVIVRRRRLAVAPDSQNTTPTAETVPVAIEAAPSEPVAAEVSREAARREARIFRLGEPAPEQDAGGLAVVGVPSAKSFIEHRAVPLGAAVATETPLSTTVSETPASAFTGTAGAVADRAVQGVKLPRKKRRLNDPLKAPTLLRHEVFVSHVAEVQAAAEAVAASEKDAGATLGAATTPGAPRELVPQAAWDELSKRLAALDLGPCVPFEFAIDDAQVQRFVQLDTALKQLADTRKMLELLTERQARFASLCS